MVIDSQIRMSFDEGDQYHLYPINDSEPKLSRSFLSSKKTHSVALDREPSMVSVHGTRTKFIHTDPNEKTHFLLRIFRISGTVLFSWQMLFRIIFYTSITVTLLVLKQAGKFQQVYFDSFTNKTVFVANVISFKPTGHALLGTALGLLLVYRTNSSYDRFWEGRKLFCTLASNCTDLMRSFKAWEPDLDLSVLKNLLLCFCVAIRQRLRREDDPEKYLVFLDEKQRKYMKVFFIDYLSFLRSLSLPFFSY